MIGRPKPPPLDTAARLHERERSRVPAAAMAPEAVPALGIARAGGPVVPMLIHRREPGPRDVVIEIEFCGLCHSDVHTGRGEWGTKRLPLVPGHEMVGIVSQTGNAVADLDVGTRVGVGCLVDSCRECGECRAGLEQFCTRSVATYGGHDARTGEYTQGGYSTRIVVDAGYVLRIPAALDPAAAAPLLCAGITTYSPLRHHNVGPGSRVGVLGLGGLGHMAVKLAVAMGAEVTVLTRGDAKHDSALALGAHTVIDTLDAAALRGIRDTLDLLIDTVSAPHEVGPYLKALRRDGALVQLSLPDGPMPGFDTRELVHKRLSYTGSLIGSIAQTQEMLDFCAEHQVACEIELTGAQHINEAWDRMVAADVKYRFVLDAATLRGNDHMEGA
ncbi:NAD(P)-dependent alcohol dehydrogenase [Paeniglutamicibacter psychrophenolicus]|uniref:NAD(P)-dependent alcohol dehydrogenase n=1 Tax=Paeniglutamicibacter psychrophenolicus TaxID=257454 RepID=UPI002783B9B1|nr:putative zinc-type alcohol dehydrogenase-like protein [Paeniglutamicibacter psychrophenolicus]